MHCKKCDLEITDSDDAVCPLCNTPLEEEDQGNDGGLRDKLCEDQELKELITAIADTVKKSLDKDKQITKDNQEASFDLEKALSDEESTLSKGAVPAAVQISEYGRSNKHLSKKVFAVLVVIIAVVGSVIAAYFYALNEPKTVKQTMPIPDTVPSSQDKPATQPEINVQSEQQKEAPGQLPDKTSPAVTVVSPPVAMVTKEQIPEQKPAEQPPPKNAEPAKMATTVAAEFYTVNVGSFKFKKSVDGVKKVLSKKGYTPSVETVTLNDKSTWYRVNVGQFKTREEATRFAQELEKKQKLETMVLKKK